MQIFGLKIKVKLEKDLAKKNDLSGYFDAIGNQIVIDDALKGRELLQVLFHEAGHAALHRTGLTITSMNDDMHELIVDNIATAIVENLSDKEVRSVLKRVFG